MCSGCFVPNATNSLKNLAVTVQVVSWFKYMFKEAVVRRKRGLCFLLVHLQQLRRSMLHMYDAGSQLNSLLLRVTII